MQGPLGKKTRRRKENKFHFLIPLFACGRGCSFFDVRVTTPCTEKQISGMTTSSVEGCKEAQKSAENHKSVVVFVYCLLDCVDMNVYLWRSDRCLAA